MTDQDWEVEGGAGGGAAQTPWAQDIDAAGFILDNVGGLYMNQLDLFRPNRLDTDTFIYQAFDDEIGFDVGASLPEGGILLELRVLDGVATANLNESRLGMSDGGDVASATILTLPSKGNSFRITGLVTIEEINPARWLPGSVIHLRFDGSLEVTNNVALGNNPILFNTDESYFSSPQEILTLKLDGDGVSWREVSRSGPFGGIPEITWNNQNTSLNIDANINALNVVMEGTFTVNTGNMLLNNGGIFQADAGGAPGLNLFANRIIIQDTGDGPNLNSTFAGGVEIAGILRTEKNIVLEGSTSNDHILGVGEIHSALTDTFGKPANGFLKMADGESLQWRNLANNNDHSIRFQIDDFDIYINDVLEYEFTDAHLSLKDNNLIEVAHQLFSTALSRPADVNAIWADADGMHLNFTGAESFFISVNGNDTYEFSNQALDIGSRDITGVSHIQLTGTGGATIEAIPNVHSSAFRTVLNAGTGRDIRLSGDLWNIDINSSGADFGNLDLIDVESLQFGDMAPPVGTIPSISYEGGIPNQMTLNVPAGGDFVLSQNEVPLLIITDFSINVTGAELDEVGQIVSEASQNEDNGFIFMSHDQVIAWDTGDNGANNSIGFGPTDLFELKFNGSNLEYTFSQTEADWQGNNLTGLGRINLSAAAASAGSDPAMWWDGADINLNVPTGAGYALSINDVDAYFFGLSGLNVIGRNITNAGNLFDHIVASVPSNVVQVFGQDDFPDVGGRIIPTPGVTYLIMRPITITKQMRHSGITGFKPAVIRANARDGDIITVNVGSSVFLDSPGFDGQIVFQNLVIEGDGMGPFAHVRGDFQNTTLVELDNCTVSGFAGGTFFDTCIFNMNNASFWGGSNTITLIDAESTIADAFSANFSDTNNPFLRVQSSGPGSTDPCFVTVRNSKLSSQANESFFFLHNNIIDGSTIRLNGIDHSPFTPGTGDFFGTESGVITGLADSGGAPGVRTLVFSAGHDVADGDTITQAGFTTETQMNGTFVASNILPGTSYEIVAVFGVTDAGTYVQVGLTQDDIKVSSFDNPGERDSIAQGVIFRKDNTVVTTLAATTWTVIEVDGAALSSQNRRWSLVNADQASIQYDGIEDFFGVASATLSVQANTGSAEYRYRFSKNGSPLPDAMEFKAEGPSTSIVTVTMMAPVDVSTGDTIQIEVFNQDNGNDIFIRNLTMIIQ